MRDAGGVFSDILSIASTVEAEEMPGGTGFSLVGESESHSVVSDSL